MKAFITDCCYPVNQSITIHFNKAFFLKIEKKTEYTLEISIIVNCIELNMSEKIIRTKFIRGGI